LTSLGAGRPLKVAINAQITPHSGNGGLETVLVGLVKALGRLTGGPEEYVIIAPAENPESWEPYAGANQRVVRGPESPPPVSSGKRETLKRSLGPLLPGATRLYRSMFPLPPASRWPEVPISNGFYEGMGCDVIHFAYQDYTFCALPTIYNPHDLQHRHFPQFFTLPTLAWRETIYPAGCRLSHTVAVTSQWVKQDVERQYGIHPDRIQVIPWAPPTEVYAEPEPEALAAARDKFGLAADFALYPAMTWEHKNHIRLLEALALLRDRDGLTLRLVCTGARTDFWPRIEERARELRLGAQVDFLGMVAPEELRALYRLAQFVFIPTTFEAASAPLFEAWQDGVPAACSTVTSLPEQSAGAALLFDPFSVEAIAEAMRRMATDAPLRESLRLSGARRLRDFSWERTAKSYRAVYRRAAGRPLSEEDRALLAPDLKAQSRGLEQAASERRATL
jgi:glycosyltransferase involved in cell wall biosynthesis